MSIWKDIHQRSNGVRKREEDLIDDRPYYTKFEIIDQEKVISIESVEVNLEDLKKPLKIIKNRYQNEV